MTTSADRSHSCRPFLNLGCILTLATFSASASSAEPRAALEVVERADGIGTLRVKFLDIGAGFSVERIRLELEQRSPVAPVASEHSTRVETVFYDVRIPAEVLDQPKPEVEHLLDFRHDPAEPYALAHLCFWLDRPDSTVTVAMQPTFLAADGSLIDLVVEPEEVELKLRNEVRYQALPVPPGEACEP